MSNAELKILIQAQDQATAVLKSVGTQLRALQKEQEELGEDTKKSAKKQAGAYDHIKNASSVMSKAVGSSLKAVGGWLRDVSVVAGGNLLSAGFQGMAKGAKSLIDVINPLSDDSIKYASAIQTNRMALDILTGSSENAKKVMIDIYNLDKKAVLFDYADIAEQTKKLIAMGVSLEDIKPVMENLTTISSGLGKEKLPLLALAFGQVKTAGRLTGAELRQFSENGVPLLEAITSKLNGTADAQGALLEATKKGGKATKDNSAKIGEYSAKLGIAQRNLGDLLQNEEASFGTDYQNRIAKAQREVDKYTSKISESGKAMGVTTQISKLSMQEVQKMISEGRISYALVKDTLAEMTKEGGKFNGLLDAPAKTLDGRVAQIKSAMQEVKLAVLGVSKDGDVEEGGLFDTITKSAGTLLKWMVTNKDRLIQMIGLPFVEGKKFILDNKVEIKNFISGSWQELVNAFVYFKDNVLPGLKQSAKDGMEWLKSEDGKKAMRETKQSIETIGGAFRSLGDAINWTKDAWSNWSNFVKSTNNVTEKMSNDTSNFARNLFGKPSLDRDGKGIVNVKNGVVGKRATGEMNMSGGRYIVGERGPEVVTLPSGSNVSTNRESRSMMNKQGNTYNINLPANSYFINTESDKMNFVRSIQSALRTITA